MMKSCKIILQKPDGFGRWTRKIQIYPAQFWLRLLFSQKVAPNLGCSFPHKDQHKISNFTGFLGQTLTTDNFTCFFEIPWWATNWKHILFSGGGCLQKTARLIGLPWQRRADNKVEENLYRTHLENGYRRSPFDHWHCKSSIHISKVVLRCRSLLQLAQKAKTAKDGEENHNLFPLFGEGFVHSCVLFSLAPWMQRWF